MKTAKKDDISRQDAQNDARDGHRAVPGDGHDQHFQLFYEDQL